MQDKILANTAHVSIFQTDGMAISDWLTIKERLEKTENVKSVSATVYESAVIVGAQTTSYAILRVVPNPKSQVHSQSERFCFISISQQNNFNNL